MKRELYYTGEYDTNSNDDMVYVDYYLADNNGDYCAIERVYDDEDRYYFDITGINELSRDLFEIVG